MIESAPSRNTAGIVSLILGVMVFSTQDAIIKALSGDYPVTEAIFVRGVVSAPILLAMVQHEIGWRAIFQADMKALTIRGLILLSAYTTYYMAIAALPLAEAVAIFFIAPILVTLMSGPLLGERVKPATWIAVLIGFTGVAVILRPGTSVFEPAALLSVASALAYAYSMVRARKLSGQVSTTVMTFITNFVYLVGASIFALLMMAFGIVHMPHPAMDFLVRPWVLPGWTDLGLMGACGVIAAVAMSLLTHAYRSAKASLVTVFEYTGMIWAPLWGFLFFAEVPDVMVWIGIALIVAAGLFAARFAQQEKA